MCSASTYGYGYPTLRVDEAGDKQQTWTDVFGNTVEVDQESSAGTLSLSTCYQHDALNDLTAVVQGSQTRSYAHDGLGRETSETTPEAGTVDYYFTNASGGLCAGSSAQVCRRTDARGITTTYSYDGESRLTSKSYSDGTPTATYDYDQTSVWGISTTNPRGRMTLAQGGAPADTAFIGHDAMGRVAEAQQCTPYNCGTSAWQMNYTYDLAGDETSWTHPQGFTITQTFSNAQRISQITSTYSDSEHPPTLATIHYAPQGAISTLVDGCVGSSCTNVQETYGYNKRLQTTLIEFGTSSSESWVRDIKVRIRLSGGPPSNPRSDR